MLTKSNKKDIIFLILFILLIILSIICISKPSVIVLSYHDFMSDKEKMKYQKNNGFVISDKLFEEQIISLKKQGYHSINSSELYCWMKQKCKIPNKSVLITIDDGNISAHKYAIPILEKYNFDAIIFIITGRVNKTSNEYTPTKSSFIGLDLIEDIHSNHKKIELASHSHNLHKRIGNQSAALSLTENELLIDVKSSNKIINTQIYCYPFGAYNQSMLQALKHNKVKMAFKYREFSSVKQTDKLLEIPRIGIDGNQTIKNFNKIINYYKIYK